MTLLALLLRSHCIIPHIGQIDQIDHDLDHLVPHLEELAQDLHSTDPTHDICGRSCRVYRSHPATWATVDRTRSGIDLPRET